MMRPYELNCSSGSSCRSSRKIGDNLLGFHVATGNDRLIFARAALACFLRSDVLAELWEESAPARRWLLLDSVDVSSESVLLSCFWSVWESFLGLVKRDSKTSCSISLLSSDVPLSGFGRDAESGWTECVGDAACFLSASGKFPCVCSWLETFLRFSSSRISDRVIVPSSLMKVKMFPLTNLLYRKALKYRSRFVSFAVLIGMAKRRTQRHMPSILWVCAPEAATNSRAWFTVKW